LSKKVEENVKLEGLKIAKKVKVEIPVKSLSVARKAELVGDSPKLQKWLQEIEEIRKNPEILKHVSTKKPVALGELKLKESVEINVEGQKEEKE